MPAVVPAVVAVAMIPVAVVPVTFSPLPPSGANPFDEIDFGCISGGFPIGGGVGPTLDVGFFSGATGSPQTRELALSGHGTKPDIDVIPGQVDFGDVAEEREREVVNAVESTVAGTPPFVLPIGGFGAFPDAARPGVVWVGCAPVPALELLQDRIERQMESIGFPMEGRPFRPHFTLGRVRRDAKHAAIRPLGQRMDEVSYGTEFQV